MSTSENTMKAVVFGGVSKVSVQDRPIPKIQDAGDIVVKVNLTALCGSDLHAYRGHEASEVGVIMGHEFTGTVAVIGSAVQSVEVGDKVVVPFTVSCGVCYFCKNKATARCIKSMCFGSALLDGAQAEYVRVPYADGTVFKAPTTIPDEALILMADIFPTGYFGVKSAVEMSPDLDISESTMVVIGCGPVGLCAIVAAAARKPKHLFAVDSISSRLNEAKKLGAEPFNFLEDRAGMLERIMAVTDGRGADIVVEVVGLSPALKTAFELVRSFGAISSIGVHNAEIPWSGADGYNKNVRLQMGRCPVRSVFPEALKLLEENQQKFGPFFENVMPLSSAVEAYELFNQAKVQKVIFKP